MHGQCFVVTLSTPDPGSLRIPPTPPGRVVRLVEQAMHAKAYLSSVLLPISAGAWGAVSLWLHLIEPAQELKIDLLTPVRAENVQDHIH